MTPTLTWLFNRHLRDISINWLKDNNYEALEPLNPKTMQVDKKQASEGFKGIYRKEMK